MAKRTIAEVKQIATNDIDAEDIKHVSSLVNFSLTREQVAFVIAACEDVPSDDQYRALLTEMYTGTEQSVIDAAWEMTGFDGSQDDRSAMQVYIDAFAAAHDGRVPNLSPNALWAVLSDEDNQKQYNTVDEWIDAIEEEEDEPSDEEGRNKFAAIDLEKIKNTEVSAFAIADELAKDEELQSLLSKTADTSQFLKIAPVLLMQRIEEHFGDAMEGWPVPGSRHKDGLPMEGNIRYDRYKTVQGTKKKMMSFYGLIFNRFPEGISINKELAEMARGDDGRYAVGPSTGWTLAKVNAERKTLEKRFKDQVTYFGNAVRLHQQLSWLKKYPGCEVELDVDVDGSLRRTTTPFILTPKTNGKLEIKYASPMTIGDVLRFDRDKAMTGMAGKAGGTWDALLETKKRVKTDAQIAADLAEAKKLVEAAIKDGRLTATGMVAPSAQATEVGLVKNIAQAESYISMVAHFGRDMMEKEAGEPMVKEFAKALSTNQDLALSCRDLIRFADSIRGRVETLVRKIEAQEIQAKSGNGNGKHEAKTA